MPRFLGIDFIHDNDSEDLNPFFGCQWEPHWDEEPIQVTPDSTTNTDTSTPESTVICEPEVTDVTDVADRQRDAGLVPLKAIPVKKSSVVNNNNNNSDNNIGGQSASSDTQCGVHFDPHSVTNNSSNTSSQALVTTLSNNLVNTLDKTLDNTSGNTLANISDNTLNNTSDNTLVNICGKTLDKTLSNTLAKSLVNSSDNTFVKPMDNTIISSINTVINGPTLEVTSMKTTHRSLETTRPLDIQCVPEFKKRLTKPMTTFPKLFTTDFDIKSIFNTNIANAIKSQTINSFDPKVPLLSNNNYPSGGFTSGSRNSLIMRSNVTKLSELSQSIHQTPVTTRNRYQQMLNHCDNDFTGIGSTRTVASLHSRHMKPISQSVPTYGYRLNALKSTTNLNNYSIVGNHNNYLNGCLQTSKWSDPKPYSMGCDLNQMSTKSANNNCFTINEPKVIENEMNGDHIVFDLTVNATKSLIHSEDVIERNESIKRDATTQTSGSVMSDVCIQTMNQPVDVTSMQMDNNSSRLFNNIGSFSLNIWPQSKQSVNTNDGYFDDNRSTPFSMRSTINKSYDRQLAYITKPSGSGVNLGVNSGLAFKSNITPKPGLISHYFDKSSEHFDTSRNKSLATNSFKSFAPKVLNKFYNKSSFNSINKSEE